MFVAKNAKTVSAALTAKVAEMEKTCQEVYRGYVTAVFHRVLTQTPQWTGSAVANWNLSVGSPDYTVNLGWKVQSEDTDEPRFSKGITPATQDALFANSDTLSGRFMLGSVYYLANAAENMKGERYIQMLEDNPNNFLRPENEPGQMVRLTALRAKLGVLSPVQQQSLRVLQPGQFNNPGVGI